MGEARRASAAMIRRSEKGDSVAPRLYATAVARFPIGAPRGRARSVIAVFQAKGDGDLMRLAAQATVAPIEDIINGSGRELMIARPLADGDALPIKAAARLRNSGQVNTQRFRRRRWFNPIYRDRIDLHVS